MFEYQSTLVLFPFGGGDDGYGNFKAILALRQEAGLTPGQGISDGSLLGWTPTLESSRALDPVEEEVLCLFRIQ